MTPFISNLDRWYKNLSEVLVLRAWRAKDRFKSMLVSENAGLRTRRSTPPKLKSVGKDVSVSSLTDAIAGGPTEAFQQKLWALSHGTAAQGTGHTTERKNRTSLVSQWSLSTQTTLLGCFFAHCALAQPTYNATTYQYPRTHTWARPTAPSSVG